MSKGGDSFIPSVSSQLNLAMSSFRVPLEAIKRNHKVITRMIERQIQTLLLNINKLIESDQADKREAFAKIVKNYEKFHQSLKQLIDQHNDYVERLTARVDQLLRFEAIVSKISATSSQNSASTQMPDELSNWYKEQIDLAICSYLIRTGNVEVGYKLLQQKNLTKLVDYDIIEKGLEIYKEIKEKKNLNILIEWCDANKKTLSKLNNSSNGNSFESSVQGQNLGFETYFQKFIELLKEHRIFDSIELSKNYLINHIGKEEEIELGFGKPDMKEFIRMKVDLDAQKDISMTTDITTNASAAVDVTKVNGAAGKGNKESARDSEFLSKMISASRLLLYDALSVTEVAGGLEMSTSSTTGAGVDDKNFQGKSFIGKLMGMFQNKEVNSLDYYDPLFNEYNELREKFLMKCADLYSSQRWTKLADFFLYNYNKLHGINQNIEFLVLLSTGMSALKTKTCNTHHISTEKPRAEDINFDDFLTTKDRFLDRAFNHCPICSLELRHLSQSLPYSHQVVSNIFNNPVMFPSGNIYSLNQVLRLNENWNLGSGRSSVIQRKKKKTCKRKNAVELKDRAKGRGAKRLFKQIYSDKESSNTPRGNGLRDNIIHPANDIDDDDGDYEDDEDEDDDEDDDIDDDDDDDDDVDDGDDIDDVYIEDETRTHEREVDQTQTDEEQGLETDEQDEDTVPLCEDFDSDQETSKYDNFLEQENFHSDMVFEDLKYLGKFKIRDPWTEETFLSTELVKVFPT